MAAGVMAAGQSGQNRASVRGSRVRSPSQQRSVCRVQETQGPSRSTFFAFVSQRGASAACDARLDTPYTLPVVPTGPTAGASALAI